ncbi:hypothetical protein Forpe1208_v006796 [Fusarium oxysporum f. sp. rapae]|uniref:Uncharacterized protein n=1 Tax=Fusarium oxysporum f. sp. rapae TaxID=485398 RepID=A0A8J5P019_FUSOX|nr:hypothetical protein Forpe1208_v006796 [Fusarium oxysporum f. sp. rapae]
MPNVHTLASRPMDIQRRLQVPSLDYSISVDGLRNLLGQNGTTLRLNVGFTDFLLPLLESLTTQAKDNGPTSKITRLLYADEDVQCLSGLHRMTSLKPNIFDHLLQLDLCLSCNYGEGYAPRGFTACLANARSLETLKICNEQVLIPCSPSIIPTLPELANVEFVEMNLIGRPEDPLISETVDFIRRHAKTLKRLCFTSSVVKGFFLAELSNLNMLRSERFVIASEDDTDDDDYGNVTNNGSESHGENMHGGEETQTSTHTLIFDSTTCERAAFYATRDNLWKERGYNLKDVKALDSATLERRDEHGIAHDIGPGSIYHFETGLWVNSDEIFYDPVADEEVDDHFEKRELPKDDSWTIQGQRSWDSETGLWRDGDGKLKKFATERGLPERPEVPDEDEGSDFDIDMQPFYDREEDEYLLRIENSPRWDWRRDAEGDVWYWKVSGTVGHATEIWRFEHKEEFAYGNEPLDFWDDWYDDRGDKAEATPYGWNLVAFSECHELGSEIPQRGTCESVHDDPSCLTFTFA